ncbi:MAG: TaqI-like C-terminal specificity domain-containing protein [Bacteroidota bacterium]
MVNYIVENTVGKLIEGKTPKEIAKMRFADISCGSGSFLITVFDKVLEYHRKWYQDNTEQAKKDGCILHEGKWVLSLKQKQNILLNNIYGVDLDPQAIEVTQLSLYLKLLEDETTATANETWVMFKEQILPGLNNNIVCGNSLIGTDILDLTLFKGAVDELKLRPMNFEDVFPDVFKKGSSTGSEQGFDAIVGNPPYRMIQPHNTHENLLKYIKEKYEAASFKIDLFHLFLNKGLRLTKNEGYLSYIIPTTILNNVYAENLRKWILDNTRIKSIVTSKERIFPDADVYTTVFVFQKSDNGNIENNIMTSFELQNLRTEQILKYNIVNQSNFYKTSGFIWNILLGESNFKLIQKMEQESVPLEDIAFINRGLITGDRNKYFSNNKITEQYIEILAGADVFRYYSNQPNEYVLFKRPKTSGGCWDKEVHLAEHKIIIRQIGFEPTASLILDPIAVTGNIFTIRHKLKDKDVEKLLLAIINSSLIEFYWKIMFADFKNSFPQVTIESIAKIPIKGVNQTTNNKYFENPIVKLVDQMLEAKKQVAAAKTASEKEYLEKKCSIIDRQIDALVYELYGLTEEEIKIVEGN